mmetsp:Transcript_5149/g.8050  ORF Transcript_5149/g.8050 Transcript_5149/m.8050 type:complete len:779 (-) Transcript_5149:111-2447(-)
MAVADDDDDLPLPKDACFPKEDFSLCDTSSNTVLTFQQQEEEQTNNRRRYWLVGRQAATVDLRIQHGSISRKHALLYSKSGDTTTTTTELIIHHLGGKHGTHVNGQRVEGSVSLKPGDVITFGKVSDRSFAVVQQKQVVETNNKSETTATASNDADSAANNNDQEATKEIPSDDDNGGDEKSIRLELSTAASTRTDRESQIAAMVASLDETPSYQKYTPKEVVEEEESNMTKNNDEGESSLSSPDNSKLLSSMASKYQLPITHYYSIEQPSPPPSVSEKQQQQPSLTSLVVDPSGSRFATGQGSYVRLYDFSGMNRLRTTPFQTILVEDGGYIVEHLCYSNSGDRLVVGTTSSQPSIFDRDGQQVMQFIRGDLYVMDMAQTSGHVNEVTGVSWHPFERNLVLTSSLDGSARQWNLVGKTQFHKLVSDKVYRVKNPKGQRTQVACVVYHPGGREFAVGTSCGTLQLWNAAIIKPRPERMVVVGTSSSITSLSYNPDGTQIATRSNDNNNDDTTSIHIWDTRRLSKSSQPLFSCSDVPSLYKTANCEYSPNGKMLLVACSQYRNDTTTTKANTMEGIIKIFSVKEKKLIGEVPASKLGVGVVQVKWHSKLNQILVGNSDGSIDVYYDETMSRNGALLSVAKAGKTVDSLSQLLASRIPTNGVMGEIIAPFASHGSKRKKAGGDDDSETPSARSRRRIPEPPARGIKVGGQSSASATFTQFISGEMKKKAKMIAGRDPRQDLFQYHDKNSNKANQTILAEKTMEQEEEEEKQQQQQQGQSK